MIECCLERTLVIVTQSINDDSQPSTNISSFMDRREDFQRVSVDSIQHWETLKTNYRNAAIASLEEYILANGLASERDALMTCINEVLASRTQRPIFSDAFGCFSLSTGHSVLQSPTCASMDKTTSRLIRASKVCHYLSSH